MITTKSVFIALGILVILVGMVTGYSPRQFLCDVGAPWCASTRI